MTIGYLIRNDLTGLYLVDGEGVQWTPQINKARVFEWMPEAMEAGNALAEDYPVSVFELI